MNERPFERHYGELRCRRYLFDTVAEPADQTPRPEGLPPKRPAASPRPPAGRTDRPQ
jgi:hypothetical protein